MYKTSWRFATVVVALFFALAGSAFAEMSKSMLLAAQPDIPDVEQCHGILTQDILNHVNAAADDPGVTFEAWRNAHRRMMEAPPVVECESKMWRALRKKAGLLNAAAVPTGTEVMSLQPSAGAASLALTTLSASVNANVDPSGGEGQYQGEMQIMANPNNANALAAGANTFHADANCLSPTGGANTSGTQTLYGSSDGGSTWTARCAPWPSTLTGGVSGANAWFGSDPAIAWDAQGRAYAAYMLLSSNSTNNDAGAAIVVARSSDNGNSWSYLGTVVNHIGNGAYFDDKEMMAIDRSAGPASTKSHPGRIYVIWDENNYERVAYSDGGVSWTTVALPMSAGDDVGGDVVVGADGTVYAIWNRVNSPERTVFSRSTDGGSTWSSPITIATHTLQSFGGNNKPPAQDNRGVNAFGSIDVDTNSASAYFGYLYVAFSDFASGVSSGTDLDVYVITSTNGGVSWSTPTRVNDDSGSATQFFPWLSVDASDGSVNVSWYDTRVDPTNNTHAQVFYARSSNGGISFEPNILVTDNGGTVWRNSVGYSDENYWDNYSGNANQYGDYGGMAAANRQVHPFWCDSRQFYPYGDTVSPSRAEDAGSAAIVNCSAPAPVATPSVTAACSPARVHVSWSALGAWGTNATGGSYAVYRSTSASFSGGVVLLASNLTGTTYDDTTGTRGTTYYYMVVAKNNCPGTALTPMSTSSPASAGVAFPSCGSTGGGGTTAGASKLKADFDGDGKSDILWHNSSTGASSIWFMNGTTPNYVSIARNDGAAWSPVAVGDFDGDGKADIFWRNTVTGANEIWFMNGANVVSVASMLTVSDLNWTVVGAGDFNGDGRFDILWRNTATGENAMWLLNGAQATYSMMTQIADQNWTVGAIGDFNGDGKFDILWHNGATGANVVWIMNGASMSTYYTLITTGLTWSPTGAADYDGDGKADVFWRDAATGADAIWFMTGIGTMNPVMVGSAISTNMLRYTFGDFSGDNKADVFWRNTVTGETAVWLMNGANDVSAASLATVTDQSWQPVRIR